MADGLAQPWLTQADSDLGAAHRVFDPDDHGTYCQAIAKYQQTVEKSVKAMIVAAYEAGVLASLPRFKHEIDNLVSVLVRLPGARGSRDVRDIRSQILALLTEHFRGEIRAISSLVPRTENPEEPVRRNTEYPFPNSRGEWMAPADRGAFSQDETRRFQRLANRTHGGARKIVSALRRVMR